MRLSTNITAGIWNTMPSATMMLKNRSKYSTASMIGRACYYVINSGSIVFSSALPPSTLT